MEGQKLAETIWSTQIISRSPSLILGPFQDKGNDVTESNASLGSTKLSEPLLIGTTLIEGTVIPSKITQSCYAITLFAGSILLSNFVCYYVYQTLINPNPVLGKLLFSPSATVFAVSILSQIVRVLISSLFACSFDALHWQLASREKGVPITTFLGLSRSTSRMGVWMLLFTNGKHRIWCLQRYENMILSWYVCRLLYPALCAIVGLILTGIFVNQASVTESDLVNITFKNVYHPLYSVSVLAGLAPINISLLRFVPVSIMCVYFSSNTYSILGASNFVTGVPPVRCSGSNCTSVFLPGGLELARLNDGNLNATLLNGTALNHAPVIMINNAPGFQVEFSPMDSDFAFNTSDCVTFGQQRGQGLYLCVGSRNSTLQAGRFKIWACADDRMECLSNTPLPSRSLFQRYELDRYSRSIHHNGYFQTICNSSIRFAKSFDPECWITLISRSSWI